MKSHISAVFFDPACHERAAVLLHPGSSVFDRTAHPGYFLSEMEKHHASEREPELGRRGFSQARKNDAKLAGQCISKAIMHLEGDKERSNCSTAESEQELRLLANCWIFVCK